MRTLFFNGKIYTNTSFFAAMIIADGKIVAIGDNNLLDDISNYEEKVDLEKRLVLPGFNDSHLHLFLQAKKARTAILDDAKSIEEIVEIGKKHLANNPDLTVLIGEGFNQDKFIKPVIPTKEDLDLISTEIPIIFSRICGHIVSVNSRALEMCGINEEKKIDGGQILVDSNHKPNGILTENACGLLGMFDPIYNETTARELLDEVIVYALEHGVTSVQTNDLNLDNSEYLQEAYIKCSLQEKIRINHQVSLGSIDKYLWFKKQFTSNDFNTLGPLKIFLDGSLGARTAALTSPYADDKSSYGVTCYQYEELQQLVAVANREKVQLIFHAIGDKAISDVLDAFEASNELKNPLRHGIVHLQITDETILKRMKKNNICALVQPAFLDYDMGIVAERVGEKLASTCYAWKTLLESVPTSFGTDLPVEEINPFKGLYLAVTRRNFNKTKIYNNNQFISLHQAVAAYTSGSSYQEFMEDKKGLLQVGYFADFIVLDRDIFAVPCEELLQTKVLKTYVSGKKVYEAKKF